MAQPDRQPSTVGDGEMDRKPTIAVLGGSVMAVGGLLVLGSGCGGTVASAGRWLSIIVGGGALLAGIATLIRAAPALGSNAPTVTSSTAAAASPPSTCIHGPVDID